MYTVANNYRSDSQLKSFRNNKTLYSVVYFSFWIIIHPRWLGG